MTTWKLIVRTWFGWSRHPEELSYFGRMRLRFGSSRAFYLLLILIGFQLFPVVKAYGLNSMYISHTLQRILPADFILPLVFWAYVGLPGIGYVTLARRAASDVLTTTQGRCFDVRLASSNYLFARIGPTLESARWHPLPIEWDLIVIQTDDTYEVEYLPTSGWVRRVRRFGASPRELVQRAPSEANSGAPAAVAAKEDTQPREDEQRELRRYAWRVWSCWGEPAVTIAACGWTGILRPYSETANAVR